MWSLGLIVGLREVETLDAQRFETLDEQLGMLDFPHWKTGHKNITRTEAHSLKNSCLLKTRVKIIGGKTI